jgi:catechol 2,3-dioxygenase-like lactoylglutathione lyase family enzyme
MNPRSLSHVALGVSDYDRSLHFYRDLLGFQVSQEVTEFGGTRTRGWTKPCCSCSFTPRPTTRSCARSN